MTPTLLPEAVRSLEAAEIAAFADLYRAAGVEAAAATGLRVSTVGDATLFTANRLDVLALNRLVGAGIGGRVSDAALDEQLAAIAASGSPRAFVAVAPFDGADELAARLEARGLRPYNNWMRLHRDVAGSDALPPPAPGLEVRAIGPGDAASFGRIVSRAFGYPPPLATVVEQSIGRAGWHHYLVLAAGEPIAAGAMFAHGESAWFGMAATDEAHRGRGAQQALVARRLRDAAAEGCRRVSVESAEDTIARDAPSFRNLRRFGFEVAYRRPNYLWTAGSLGARG